MSLVTDLPAIFDQFSEARQKGFLTVMDLKERGIPLVGTLLHLYAAKRSRWQPVRLWFRSVPPLMKPLKKRERSAAQPLPAD